LGVTETKKNVYKVTVFEDISTFEGVHMKINMLVISSIVLAVVGFSTFIILSQNNRYQTSSSLPSWVVSGVEKTASELFESFKITSSVSSPNIGSIFPLQSLTSIEGNTIELRGKISILIVGSVNCSSCVTAIKTLKSDLAIQVVHIVPYGSIPIVSEENVRFVDARLEATKNSMEIVPTSGKLKTWIGLAQFTGAYVLDRQGRIYLALMQAPQAERLELAVMRIRNNKPPLQEIEQPQLKQAMKPVMESEKSKLLQSVLKAKTGVVIFTADGCNACNGLSDEVMIAVKKWQAQGVSVAIVNSGRQRNGEFLPGIPIVADPESTLSNAWGRIGLPQATLLNQGQYAGTVPFAESQFNRQLPGQPAESFKTKAPFTQAIGKSIDYLEEKRGDSKP
jgi:hypothetical protein